MPEDESVVFEHLCHFNGVIAHVLEVVSGVNQSQIDGIPIRGGVELHAVAEKLGVALEAEVPRNRAQAAGGYKVLVGVQIVIVGGGLRRQVKRKNPCSLRSVQQENGSRQAIVRAHLKNRLRATGLGH